ncbi:MAG: CarD family transcriptional regulator [Ruminococcus sp.]|nr:CarD family transcriptional regulator [Ruminococcus sp.]
MFKPEDIVVYSTYGVCRVDAVEERDFTGSAEKYYILRPVGDSRNTFYVPVANENLTRLMRKVLTREEIQELINIMPDDNYIWIEDEFRRKEEYRRIIRDGDRAELVKLIKTLYIHRKERSELKKKLHSADEHFLKEAENLLHDEFAYVLGIKREEVIPYIRSHI